MNDKINFILPDFLCLSRSKLLFDIFDKYPFILRTNVNIYSFFGTFPCAIWNGGRNSSLEPPVSESFMKKVRDFYNKRGIKVTFTFTNYLIEERHLTDKYCNTILEVFNNGMNEVLVSSNVLEKYIRDKYPNYKINKSITAATNDRKEETDKYNIVVLNKDFNRDINYLKTIKNKHQIEILVDEVCYSNCPFAREHYKEISALQIKEYPTNRHQLYGKCRYQDKLRKYNTTKERNEKSNYRITPNEIEKVYYPLGYNLFKLSGRDKFDLFGYESVITYLIKEEYQMDVRIYLYEQMLFETKDFYLDLIERDKSYFDYLNNGEWKYV